MIEPTQDDVGRAVVYTGNRYPGGKLVACWSTAIEC
jgi:hypothetical protein